MMLILLLLLMQNNILTEGFTPETQIHTSEGYYSLDSLIELLSQTNITYDVDSCHLLSNIDDQVPITHIACGTSNCYIRIAIGIDIISCSPQQKFYLPTKCLWKEASELRAGDILLTKFVDYKQIEYIDLIKKTTKLYAIAVPKQHIFCIGKYGIVTHNMIIPGMMLSVTIPWGFEAGLPILAGFLGPATFGISLACGSVAIVAYHCYTKNNKVHNYALKFKTDELEKIFILQERAPGKPTTK